MCLIVVSDRGFADLPDHWVERVHAENPDGFGAMWVDGCRVRVRHDAPANPAALRRLLRELPRDRQVAVHLRMRTAGEVSLDNTHPFPVRHRDGTLWLMHNGTFAEHADCPREADTRRWIRNELEPMLASDDRPWTEFRDVVRDKASASGSRLVLMDDAARTLIVDSAASGRGGDGRWYSKRVNAPENLPAREPARRAPGLFGLPLRPAMLAA